jgi:very-short-patch-repair endonuclease
MPPERIARIAQEQDDLIIRDQALAAGATPDFIRYAISQAGRWQRVLPGIYATFTGPLADIHKYRAAVLYGGTNALITGAAACRMHGMKYVPDTDGIDVLVPHDRQRVDVEFVRLRRSHRVPAPVYWTGLDVPDEDVHAHIPDDMSEGDELAGGATRWMIPMTPLARAAIDAARFRHQALLDGAGKLKRPVQRKLVQDTRALLCEAVQRRRVNDSDLVAELDRGPRAHSAAVRRAMLDIIAGCRSAPECELRDVVRRSRILPEPRWNRQLPGQAGIYPDACWPAARLVVEVDSKEWHRFGAGVERTERRQALYAELGWRVVSVSPYRIRAEPDAVRLQLERAYLTGLRASG